MKMKPVEKENKDVGRDRAARGGVFEKRTKGMPAGEPDKDKEGEFRSHRQHGDQAAATENTRRNGPPSETHSLPESSWRGTENVAPATPSRARTKAFPPRTQVS